LSVFGEYAGLFDLLYKDRDCNAEAAYVLSLIQEFSDNATTLLDMGCGTGQHANFLSEKGMRVTGVDRSEEIVKRANENYPSLDIRCGDMCDFEADQAFDAITALFHVVSYLTENRELHAAIKTIRNHLNPDGVVVFDCWHGPAVLSQKPETRVKRIEGENHNIVRIAEPEILAEKNRVSVKYQMFVRTDNTWDEFREVHHMRYLFPDELENLLEANGMKILHTEEWMTKAPPSENTWGVVYVVGRS
jgi:SAM-dependent methyltransferase